MTKPSELDIQQVLAIVQQRFPREYEIAVQQAYIANLEGALEKKDSDDGNELSE